MVSQRVQNQNLGRKGELSLGSSRYMDYIFTFVNGNSEIYVTAQRNYFFTVHFLDVKMEEGWSLASKRTPIYSPSKQLWPR